MSHTSNIQHIVTFALVTLATAIAFPITASAENKLDTIERDAREVLDDQRQIQLDRQRRAIDRQERQIGRRQLGRDADRGDAGAVLRDVQRARRDDSAVHRDNLRTQGDGVELARDQGRLKQDTAPSRRSSRR